jgi:ribosomal protein S18 acetylase RimI-like enzyme
VSKREETEIELLRSDPKIVAWLEPHGHTDGGDAEPPEVSAAGPAYTHTWVLKPKHGLTLRVRPLRHGDVRTVMDLFGRLSERSRRNRFNGPKPCLSASELRQLASVDGTHHVLVAYLEGDSRPVAIARLVREGRSAEIAFAVADEYQRRGIGSALAAELVGDACAAGITEITALVASDNRAAIALLRRILDVLDIRLRGPELAIRAAIA